MRHYDELVSCHQLRLRSRRLWHPVCAPRIHLECAAIAWDLNMTIQPEIGPGRASVHDIGCTTRDVIQNYPGVPDIMTLWSRNDSQ